MDPTDTSRLAARRVWYRQKRSDAASCISPTRVVIQKGSENSGESDNNCPLSLEQLVGRVEAFEKRICKQPELIAQRLQV